MASNPPSTIKSALKHWIVLVLTLVQIVILACSWLGFLPTPTPLPLPTELATTPLPDAGQLGGLEATYISVVSEDGAEDTRCYNLYRFYPDGLVLFAVNNCFSPVDEIWAEINAWFHRDNRDVSRGDYYLDDQRLWIRVVTYDSIHETTSLRSFQGEYCDGKMVLQEPGVATYAGVPSDLTEPVLAYAQLPTSGTEYPPAGCHVASYKVLFRPSVVLAGGGARYQIQTDPGEPCSLQYIDPNGTISMVEGTGTIQADVEGICEWIWEVGEAEGYGKVRVIIDEIVQDYRIEIR